MFGFGIFSIIKSFIFNNPLSTLLMGIILVVAAIVIVPNVSAIAEKFGLETRASLKEKLKQEEHNTNIAIQSNKETNATIGVIESAHKEEVKSIEKQQEVAETTQVVIRDIVEVKKEKIRKIVKAKKQPTQEAAATDEDIQISTAQVTSLWDTFCKFNTDKQCTQFATKGA